ncbi:MAG TPA: phytanoyl-CoA dioxygenase family protein [Blastocatellia bacterium]|jgi:phytanoyl-CoA hydroxylase|nr:phytanoyl-CoA dioxygenase family protein [Blastocatellia bacterium]
MPGLSTQQLASYERDGFLVIEDFAGREECERLKRRAEALVRDFDPRGVTSIFSTREQTRASDDYFLDSGDKVRFFFEEDAFAPDGGLLYAKERSINKIGHALHDLDPVFDAFSRKPELAAICADLGYAEPLLLQSMYIFKQPGIGGEVTCHQDATFLYTEPLSVAGFWFALEDATQENGCMWVIPGGHKLGLKKRFVRAAEVGQGEMIFETLDDSPWPDTAQAPLEVSQGALILLHGLLPHLSHANRSAKSRHAYTLHVIDGACEYGNDNWLRRAPDMPLRGF